MRRCRARTIESVLESHGPCESFELSIVRIGLETTELWGDNEMQIASVVGGRRARQTPVRADVAFDDPGAEVFLYPMRSRAFVLRPGSRWLSLRDSTTPLFSKRNTQHVFFRAQRETVCLCRVARHRRRETVSPRSRRHALDAGGAGE